MMQAVGKFTVPVPGTPVRLTSTQPDPGERFACHGILIQALPGNTGKVYVGTSEMSKAAMTDVYVWIAVPTSNQAPSFSVSLTIAPAGVHLNDLYIDADIANEGVLVTVLIA